MLKSIKKRGLFSFVLLGIISFSGCSMKDTTFKENLQIKKSVKNYRNNNIKPIQVIKIPSYVNKYKNINHNLGNKDIYISFNKQKPFLLGELNSIDNIPIIVDPLIKSRKINIKNFKGKISDLLNMIASLTNSYWTYNRGVIKFQKTAEVIYTFPALSLEKIAEVYNVGEDTNNKIDMDVKNSIFKELKLIVKDLADAYHIDAVIDYSNKNQKEISKIANNTVQKNKKDSYLKNKEKNTENNNQKNKKNNENSSYKLKSGSNLDDIVDSVLNQYMNTNKNSKIRARIKKAILDNLPTKSTLNKNSNFDNFSNSNNFSKKSNKFNIQSNYEKTNNSVFGINNNKKQNVLNISSFNLKESFNTPKERIVLSPNSGTVIGFVTPDEEKKLDLILTTLMKKRFSSMIRLRTIALLTTESKVRNFQNKMYSVLNRSASSGSSMGGSIELGTGGTSSYTNTALTGLSLTIGKGMSFGVPDSFTALVDYFVSNNTGSILLNPNLVLLPNIIGRIQDSTNIPYLEPEQITNTQDNTLTYKVNYVKEGVNMAYIASVFNDNLIVSLKFSIVQYLGDKTVQAGVMGTYSLPMYAPKTLQTTYRVRPGDIIVLGGLTQSKSNFEKSTHFKIPASLANSKDKLEFVLITQPQLIKFEVDKNITNYKPYKEINLNKSKKITKKTKPILIEEKLLKNNNSDILDRKIQQFIKK